MSHNPENSATPDSYNKFLEHLGKYILSVQAELSLPVSRVCDIMDITEDQYLELINGRMDLDVSQLWNLCVATSNPTATFENAFRFN